jgi:DNA-binding CsgD family transcriptional regulator
VLGAENAALSLIDLRQNAFLLNFLDNVPEAWTQQIERWGGEIIAAWGGVERFRSTPMDEPFVWSRVTSVAKRGTNSFVDEVTSAGIADSMSLVLARDDTVIGACGMGRTRRAGPYRDDELAAARLLLPHMQRAIAFSRLLELTTLRATAFEQALDALAVPTMLVTDGLHLVHANRAAYLEMERGQVLRNSNGSLATTDVRGQDQLKAALATAHDRPVAANPAELDVELAAGAGRLTLLPLPRGSMRGNLAPEATAVIVLADASRAAVLDPSAAVARLIDVHRLTKAEAAVALEIAKGDGREAAAKRLGLSQNTVRTHLSAIFDKLGIHRQAQLTRLVQSLSNP